MDEEQLINLFERLGAKDPSGLALSQTNERLPQLARFLFLRQAWKCVLPDGDISWIENLLRIDQGGPGGEIVPALTRLLSVCDCAEDLTKVVRVMQWQVLSGLCLLLDDPGDRETEVKDVAWRLFQVDGNEKPLEIIPGLIESVLETDPTGRKMQPCR